jgi:hypothetical protein
MHNRYQPVDVKNLQSKLKEAEGAAANMLMPGAHSSGPPEDGKHLPVWVDVFGKYFELKKTALSKSVQQE